MAVVTLYRLAEECLKIINGGEIQTSTNVSFGEVKASIGQVINGLLKIDYLSINAKMGETIPNGTVLGWYEGIEVVSSNGKSKSTLPIKPLKLPRNMGVWAIYPRFKNNENYQLDKEFIPMQMGQSALIKSQPMINDLLGQVGYETFGNEIIYTKDLKGLFPDVVVAMRLAVMDISLYDDYDILPLLPEQEWQVKQEVVKLYTQESTLDLVVDATGKQLQGLPVKEQKQTQ